jgi:16S rRNA (guanine527-N7)-methyltransferase
MNESYFEKRIPIFLELGFRGDRLKQLKAYIDLLWAANEELNLISRKMTFEELIDNHLVDCLLPLKHFPQNIRIAADLGAGGGLPGVVYALQFPDVEYHLFEKSVKKRDFLKRCVELAPNLRIYGEIPSVINNLDLITARAFKPLDVILELTRDYYKKGGKYFLLKARREKIDEEIAAARKRFKDLAPEIVPLTSPVLDVERHLLRI